MSKPTTLITGAAQRIGAAIARHLGEQGHDLVLHYNRSAEKAERLAGDLREMGVKVTLLQADLAQPEGLNDFWHGLPVCSHLIHNASPYRRDGIADFTAHDLRTHLAVNLESPLLLTQGFLRQLSEHTAGTVLVLGDDALGWSVAPQFFSYAVSRHAWRSIIDLLAAACAPRVRANLLALAPTLPGESDTEEMFRRLAEHAPLKRTGEIEDVLRAIDFVLNSPGLTGQIIGLGNGMALATSRPQ